MKLQYPLHAAAAAAKPTVASPSCRSAALAWPPSASPRPNPARRPPCKRRSIRFAPCPGRHGFVSTPATSIQLSKPEEFDTAQQIIQGVGKTVHCETGEHDVINDDGREFFTRFNGSADRKWYSFDADGAHFVALSNVLNLKAGGFGQLGRGSSSSGSKRT